MKIITIVALAGALLAGCAHSAKYHLASGDADSIRSLERIYLDIAPLENGPLSVEIYPEPWRYLSVSSNVAAAQYSAPPPPPGTSAGQAAAAGVAGGLIGTLIASEMAKGQAQSAAQKPAEPLVEALMGRAIERDVREALVDGMLTSDFAASNTLEYAPLPDDGAPQLVLQPSIKLTNGLNVLKFNINAELHAGGKQPLYRNSIEYWSAGTGNSDKQENLYYWRAADLEAFYGELQQAIAHTASYLAQSLDGSLPAAEEKQATHRIAGNDGWVMMRGNLLQSTDEYTVLRDLRGNIKIISGTLVL
ncbi:hypothetical protein [Microbulbifer magnicolonia]|uniref:hypothetical protein n=1 Tax=Microbulbifer magnicolonia TaxID=3109744 RepID=UPI002B412B0C|nr:hypothetical protein [Microbulbifer sp. GG15]